MQSHVYSPRWTTATISEFADTSPLELDQLRQHVSRCNGSRGRWFALRCSVDALHDFIAPRMITTLFIVGGVIAVTTLAI